MLKCKCSKYAYCPSAVSYILSDIKGEIYHFSLSADHMKQGGEGGRSSGGEVLQHMSKKPGNSGTGKPRLVSQLQMEDLPLSNL